eukprot:CAMPEP_0174856732 /NCGR_PEP_ID=MMETSP1114-20130205/36185_1 /TAXON_ID=312471 /ORGANISM="Neobodo designis, Strain CCAP 1951/1" /LENGTH=443 /DNA_ID=CAMNT_0016091537 /DNA_START=28 /DNA_END=1359 /DNA_ORIENTATION=+
MPRIVVGVVALLATIVLIGDGATAADLTLPRGFVGEWSGNPTHTVFGPLNGPFNFSIHDVNGTDGTMWLMQDFFNGYLGTTSVQQFWVKSFVDPSTGDATSNLTYCGDLQDFFVSAKGGAFVQVNLTEVVRTPGVMQWHLTASQVNAPWNVPWSGLWTLTLLSPTRLKSEFMLPEGTAVHFSVVYNRTGDAAPVPLPATLSDSTCRLPFDGVGSNSAQTRVGSLEAVAKKRRCPLGYDKVLESEVAGARHRRALAPIAAAHEHCYLVNPALNFSVAWNWNVDTQTIDVVVTTTAPGMDDRYVAIGFFPQWPAMQGMDIALGYLTHDAATGAPTGCVQSLYAQEYVGTPVPNPTQALTNTSVWTADGLMHVAFTRPWASGHTNLTAPPNDGIPAMSYAVGTVASPEAGKGACGGVPQYHGGRRGTYGVLWNYPQGALPEHMKCV